MRRGKIGDLYYIKLLNGLKFFQRAYDIPKQGSYIRVFGGLYEAIPDHVEQIVLGPHDYIVSFYSSRAYRIGLAQFVGNFPIPDDYPFPEYEFDFCPKGNGLFTIYARTVDFRESHRFVVRSMDELPGDFKEMKLLSWVPSPSVLLYLFDIDWNLSDLSRYPSGLGEEFQAKCEPYRNMVNELVELDKAKRQNRKEKQ